MLYECFVLSTLLEGEDITDTKKLIVWSGVPLHKRLSAILTHTVMNHVF